MTKCRCTITVNKKIDLEKINDRHFLIEISKSYGMTRILHAK